ncbi:MAG: hypothetical protein VX438_16700 [Planctomycetota bacterium]|nr:hypothetical protein [Planctomycetota bacterium]
MKTLWALGLMASTLASTLNAQEGAARQGSTARVLAKRTSNLPHLLRANSTLVPAQLQSIKTRIGGDFVVFKVNRQQKKQLERWARHLANLPQNKAVAFHKSLVRLSKMDTGSPRSTEARKLLTEYGFANFFPPSDHGDRSEKVTIMISWPPYVEIFIQWEG